jgi:hypothetical protein
MPKFCNVGFWHKPAHYVGNVGSERDIDFHALKALVRICRNRSQQCNVKSQQPWLLAKVVEIKDVYFRYWQRK